MWNREDDREDDLPLTNGTASPTAPLTVDEEPKDFNLFTPKQPLIQGRHIVPAVLAVIGIIAIIIAAVYYTDTYEEEVHGRFGIIFDAGGSGTRMTIYEMKGDNKLKQRVYEKCEKKGISNYEGKENDLTAPLNKCLDVAKNIVPADAEASTPIFMEATAGMRMLKIRKKSAHETVWKKIKSILNNGSFPVKLVRTMPGNMEATYSFTTINKLLNTQPLRGMVEMGSSSFQVAFEPEQGSLNPNKTDYDETVNLNGKKYKIYVHSYLCFGRNEFGRRYYAQLIKDASFSQTVMDHCGFTGFTQNFTKDYLWMEPCVSGKYAADVLGGSISDPSNKPVYTVIGTGDFGKCYQQIQSMFNKKKSCTQGSCSILDIYQPGAHGAYYSIGSGSYYAAEFTNVTSSSSSTDFRKAAEKLCSTPFSEVTTMAGYSKYAKQYCLSNAITYYMLTDVLKLSQEELGEVVFAKKINGKEMGWTYGSMLLKLSQMSKALMRRVRELGLAGFIIVLVIGIVMLVAAIVLVIHLLKKRGSKNIET